MCVGSSVGSFNGVVTGMGLPPKKENEGTLVINLYEKNWVRIGDVHVLLECVQGPKARLIIQADRNIQVVRETAIVKVKQDGQAVQDL